jgi:hypothetical protein
MRYTYAYGYKTEDKALEALWLMQSEGEVSNEGARVESYYNTDGEKRYRITLDD